jgi:hypothetical protein
MAMIFFSALNTSSPLLSIEKQCLTLYRCRNSWLTASLPLPFRVTLPTSGDIHYLVGWRAEVGGATDNSSNDIWKVLRVLSVWSASVLWFNIWKLCFFFHKYIAKSLFCINPWWLNPLPVMLEIKRLCYCTCSNKALRKIFYTLLPEALPR